jgi:predicted dehydrogenase
VLGTGIQTARKVIDDGLIGTPVFATASYLSAGPEPWHPNPGFYYQPGGGPLFDMGPYYVTALVTLLGPVASVRGQASRTRSTRLVGSGPLVGTEIPVEVDSHVTGILTHDSGAISTIVMSFDAVATRASVLEVHGEKGSMQVTDPNLFEGDVQIFPGSEWEWETVQPSAGYRDAARGVGLIDLARTRGGEDFRPNGDLGFHVLDIMESILRSASTGETVDVLSETSRPPLVPLQELDPKG